MPRGLPWPLLPQGEVGAPALITPICKETKSLDSEVSPSPYSLCAREAELTRKGLGKGPNGKTKVDLDLSLTLAVQ